MNESRSLIRYSVRSSDSKRLDCSIGALVVKHQHVIVGALAPRHGAFEIAATGHKIDDPLQQLEIVAFSRELLEPPFDIEKDRDRRALRSLGSQRRKGVTKHAIRQGFLKVSRLP